MKLPILIAASIRHLDKPSADIPIEYGDGEGLLKHSGLKHTPIPFEVRNPVLDFNPAQLSAVLARYVL